MLFCSFSLLFLDPLLRFKHEPVTEQGRRATRVHQNVLKQ